jgi:hypothetical protein
VKEDDRFGFLRPAELDAKLDAGGEADAGGLEVGHG